MIQMKRNWDQMKWNTIKAMRPEELQRLEIRDDAVYRKLTQAATCVHIKEQPFKQGSASSEQKE